jgi:four helix bundle protein
MKTFEDLEVYQKAFDFTIEIFKLTKNNPVNRNIANQLERASLSISNNISEGFELQSNRQFIKFLYISKGSCGESRNLLAVANKLSQISDEMYKELRIKAIDISRQLSNFIKYLEKSEIR